jgi:16S rRNA (uracil1498-N3)-methyltransferase
MRSHRFFINETIGGNKQLTLSDEELIHQLKQVFRLSAGDSVVLFDGSGYEYTATLDLLSKDEVRVSVGAAAAVPTPAREVWLCAAIIKKDNFEWIVQKATELGVAHIVPILAERSEKKNLNMERLVKIAREASEQSGRGTVPQIHEPTELENVFSADADKLSEMPAHKIVLHLEGESLSPEVRASTEPVALFVGPEGGWSEREVALCREKGAAIHMMGTLGTQVLRAETAAIAAVSLLLL